MTYLQGCIWAVPGGNRDAYIQHSEGMAAIMRGCGALKLGMCWGEDFPDGKATSFSKPVQCKEDEGVIFSWNVWESKAACKTGLLQMRDEAKSLLADLSKIIDPKRMVFGGFEVPVKIGREHYE